MSHPAARHWPRTRRTRRPRPASSDPGCQLRRPAAPPPSTCSLPTPWCTRTLSTAPPRREVRRGAHAYPLPPSHPYLLPAHWSELREHAVLTLPPCISPNLTLTLIEAHTYTHSPSQSERRARSSGSSGVVVSSLSRSVSPRWSTSRASSCRRRPPAG